MKLSQCKDCKYLSEDKKWCDYSLFSPYRIEQRINCPLAHPKTRKELYYDLYISKNLKIENIADIVNQPVSVVKLRLRKYGIKKTIRSRYV